MSRPHTPLALALAAGSLALLTACAASSPGALAQQAPVEPAQADDKATITGSRIPSKTTEKLVRQIGAREAQEAQRNLPPNPGPHTN